jgi:hypothetical protein
MLSWYAVNGRLKMNMTNELVFLAQYTACEHYKVKYQSSIQIIVKYLNNLQFVFNKPFVLGILCENVIASS